MAWNGSDKNEMVRAALPVRHATFGWMVAVAAVVVVGGGAIWMYANGSGRSESSPGSSGKRGLIATNAPSRVQSDAIVTEPQTPPPEKKYSQLTREEKLQYWRDKYGDNLPDNIKPIVYYLENEPKTNYKPKPRPEAIFKYRSEREIASFLMVEPGTWMMRPVEFGAKFDKDLLQSLQDRIEILPGDSAEQRRLKEAVIAAKKELFDRAKDGENPSKIMSDFSNDLYQMGQYRRDLESEIRLMKNDPSKSDVDVSIAVEAANKMLEKKGLKPIRQPNMLIRNANLRRARERQNK